MNMTRAESERSVLDRAFTLLDALVSRSDGVGLTWIAHYCGIPKSTAHRLLQQLEALGVVERSDGRYRVGAHVFRLGQAWEPYPRLLAAARRPLHDLAATTRTSAVLTVRRQREVLVAAASLARTEDGPRLRPGCTVPPDLHFVTTPVLAPTGRAIGVVGALVPRHGRPVFFGEAVRHAARTVSTALATSATPEATRR
ncbi:helix-turn-helix domain-containing protein [Saccharothrix australiensis]|uniref:Glycerol operon regulatory protein n=1 Tax=Saccharothrix australiensis TaxID=2072 RepID=A0A495W2Q7_9PSEU|nr:helix-turn-helix domain-containing protein [Saccharothrix australiensis]RKT55317.1 IclR-like helix-turn-helix domain-containing protein [Saccharothrix australiensis]